MKIKKSLLAFVLVLIFVGCYDDQALLNDPTIHPIENAEDKVAPKRDKIYFIFW